MKNIKIISLMLMTLSLASCSFMGGKSSSSSSTGSSTASSSSSSSSTSSLTWTSTSTTSVEPHQPGSGVIDLFCVNDFHGRVSKYQSGSYYEGGIARLSTYLNNKKNLNPTGSVFLNAGDLWQDTYDSAMNKGELLTKTMVAMKCEAMALGNHEFDWGTNQIIMNRTIAENDTNEINFSFLGCNIYNYVEDTHADQLCSSYKIIERGDVRIGIIGAIGESQLTSITSSNWENLTFKDPTPIVKDLSDELRTEKNCDVIVYLFHGSFDQSNASELSATSSISGKPYVDAGFLGHTHSFESEKINETPWIQSYQHGAVLGRITLNVDAGDVTCTYYPDYSSSSSYSGRNENGYGSGSSSIYAQSEDPNIKAIVDNYLTNEFTTERDKEIVTLSNASSTIGKEAGKIQAMTTSKYIDTLRLTDPSIPSVDIVINNGNRDTISVPSNGKLTKENIFNLTPFTNKTLIARVLGSDIIGECISYNNPYYIVSETSLKLDANTYYTVACIDYLLLHKNTSRNYNYFKSYTSTLYEVSKYPYEIMWDYFASNPTFDMSTLSSTAYTGLSK